MSTDINHTEIRGALYRVTLTVEFTQTISDPIVDRREGVTGYMGGAQAILVPAKTLPVKIVRGAHVLAGSEIEAIETAREKITEDIWMGHPDRFSGKIPTPQNMEVTAEVEELAGYSNLLISRSILTETWREFEDETVGFPTPVGVKAPPEPGPNKGPGRAN